MSTTPASGPSPRTLNLPIQNLSCRNCVTSITSALSPLPYLTSLSISLHDQPQRVSTLSATLSDSAPSDDLIVSQILDLLPPKFSIPSTESLSDHEEEEEDQIKPAPQPRNPQQQHQRTLRRYRCGCPTASCVCSPVPVLPGDTGVLVRVSTISSTTSSTDTLCCCATKGTTCSASSTTSDTKNVHVAISGMTCASCVAKVTATLKALPAIQEASVSLLTTRAALQVDPRRFDPDTVLQALRNSGYEAVVLRDDAERVDDVFLRFSNLDTARKAVDALNASPLVENADIYHPGADGAQSKMHPALRTVRRWLASEKSTGSTAFADDSMNKASKNHPTRQDKNLHIIRLTSRDKLAAIKTLEDGPSASDANQLPYDIISRNDPMLTGVLEAAAALQKEARHLCRLFVGAFICTLPIALCTMLFARVDALGAPGLKEFVGNTGFRVVDIIAFVLATPVQFVFGYRFYRGSWFALKQRRANMDLLIALGTSIAYFFSVIILVLNTIQIRNGHEVTEDSVAFETSSLLITIVLFGKWMETVAKKKTAAGIESLTELAPRDVLLVSKPPAAQPLFGGPVNVELVSVGDYFQVNPGSAFPLDGAVEFGQTTVDESMLTGESWPVQKKTGDPVYAGTVNGGKAVIVRCTATDSQSMLEKIIALVKRAQESRAPIEVFADKVSAVFVPIVLVIALFVTVLWFILAQTESIPTSWTEGEGNVFFALLFGLSVLVISCPCALGLATPTVVMMATSIGVRRLGICYKDGGEALQAANAVKAVLFDKTGTLTIGNPVVTSATTLGKSAQGENGKDASKIREDSLRIIAAAESYSDHPLAKAICAYADIHTTSSKDPVDLSEHEAVPGKGIKCWLVSAGEVRIGKADWVLSDVNEGASVGNGESVLQSWERAGKTVVLANVPGHPLVGFGIEDPVRYESVAVISRLREQGLRCGIVTGDSLETARAVARIVGIDDSDIHARALPEDKVQAVHEFARRGDESADLEANEQAKGVVFVGDGINDAGALSAASVGIAMGSGSQIASENAGIVLVKSNLWDVVIALDLAHKAFGRIKLNYVWALGFNSLAIPLAGGALYPVLERRIPPYAAAAAMGLSSISVVLSSLALGLYKSPELPSRTC